MIAKDDNHHLDETEQVARAGRPVVQIGEINATGCIDVHADLKVQVDIRNCKLHMTWKLSSL